MVSSGLATSSDRWDRTAAHQAIRVAESLGSAGSLVVDENGKRSSRRCISLTK